MYLKNIMSNYLNENVTNYVSGGFSPIQPKQTSWIIEDKKLSKTFSFDDRVFLEAFVVEIIKYKRESDADVELRVRGTKAGVIIHSLSFQISEIETKTQKDIDKIKKDVMYFYAKQK